MKSGISLPCEFAPWSPRYINAYQQIVDHSAISGGINSKSLLVDAGDGSTIPAQLSDIVFQLVAAATTRYQELWV